MASDDRAGPKPGGSPAPQAGNLNDPDTFILSVKASEFIFRERDPLGEMFVIAEGWVRLTRQHAGRERLVAQLEAGAGTGLDESEHLVSLPLRVAAVAPGRRWSALAPPLRAHAPAGALACGAPGRLASLARPRRSQTGQETDGVQPGAAEPSGLASGFGRPCQRTSNR
jgi:hypothetical protein